MNVILVRPPLTTGGADIHVPTNLVVLSSYLMRDGISARIVDFDLLRALNSDLNGRFFDRFMQYLPLTHGNINVIGITSMGSNYPYAIRMAEIIKRECQKSHIVFGGPHSHFVATETLRHFSFVDFVILGEGERPLRDLTNAIMKRTSYEDIGNLVWRDKKGVIVNKTNNLNDTFDDILDETYSLLDLSKYSTDTAEYKFPIYVGTGCFGNCSFCSTSVFWQRKYRVKEVASIVREISFLKEKYGYRHYSFDHDNLFANKAYIKELLAQLKKLDIKWSASSRIDCFSDEVAKIASDSGLDAVFFGIESGSAKIAREEIGKKLDIDRILAVIRLCKDLRIMASVSFIIGFLNETKDDIELTINLALQCKLSGAKQILVNPLTPLPGTYYENCRMEHNTSCLTTFNRYLTADGESRLNSIISQRKYRKEFMSYYHIKTEIDYDEISQLAYYFYYSINTVPYTLKYLEEYCNMAFMEIYEFNKELMPVIIESVYNESETTLECVAIDRLPIGDVQKEVTSSIYTYELLMAGKCMAATEGKDRKLLDWNENIKILYDSDIDIYPYLQEGKEPASINVKTACSTIYVNMEGKAGRMFINSSILDILKTIIPCSHQDLFSRLSGKFPELDDEYIQKIIDQLTSKEILR